MICFIWSALEPHCALLQVQAHNLRLGYYRTGYKPASCEDLVDLGQHEWKIREFRKWETSEISKIWPSVEPTVH